MIGAALLVSGTAALASGQVGRCDAAYYQLADGTGVDVSPSDDTHYRWRRWDGTTGLLSIRPDGEWSSTLGWTGREDGKVVDLRNCGRGRILFAGVNGGRVHFATTETRFRSGDVELAGRLVLPVGKRSVPIVVLVHGSEDSSALRFYALQRLLPAQGIGVFVYDKRGTGESQGAFTHDIRQLTTDARAALATATATAGRRADRIGYYGTSQGGWTAPLAALDGSADFVIVGYGLAVTPVDEDSEALTLDMTRHGFGQKEVSEALEIGMAAQAVARSGFEAGYEALRSVVDRYKAQPWFPFVRGNITGYIISTPEADLRVKGPQLLPGFIPDYDPMPVLRELPTPQLWILGGDDIDAPYLETFRRLAALKRQGHPVSIVIYPHVEHGLLAFETKGEERLSTRQPSSLQRLLAGYASGRPLDGSYDDAQVMP